jgi:hypothetical protein
MSSNQELPGYRVRSASGFEPQADDLTSNAQMLSMGFMRANNQQPQIIPHTHISQAPLDVTDNAHFEDFSFSYQNFSGNLLSSGIQTESTSDPYPLSRQALGSNHKASIPSKTPVAHASSNSDVAIRQNRNASISGSDEASPSSPRAGGGVEGGYGDDFRLGASGAIDGSDLGNRTREERSDHIPPWSELKTKAGKERKRLPLACIACRRKKIRCSGEKPACTHCLRSRIPCVYKVTTRKAAPRTDYMAMLDKRLKRMEERIIKIVPEEEQDSSLSVTRAVLKPSIPGTAPIRNSSGKKRAADEAFGQNLDNWSKSAPEAKLDNAEVQPPALKHDNEESKLLIEGAEILPSKEIQEHLSEVFFENIYGQAYHLLHKPSFMRKLR